MTSFRKYLQLATALSGTLLLHGELSRWVQHIDAGSPLDAIFFRTVNLPGGPVASRRPPRETIPELTKAIGAAPQRADLIALRAQESELQLEFEAAEADWKMYAAQTSNKLQGAIDLADFYRRRVQPQKEFDTLIEAAKLPTAGQDVLLRANEQTAWKLLDRSRDLIDSAALGPADQAKLYTSWMARYPEQREIYSRYGDLLIATKRYPEAEALLKTYSTRFPGDDTLPVRLRAAIEESRGSAEPARAVYDSAFRPLWPPELIADYFRLLERTRGLRAYLAAARNSIASNPTALEPAVRVFYYYQQSGNLAQAHRALLEYRLRKQEKGSAWSEDELLTVAALFEATHNYPEAARHYHEAISTEKGLTGLIRVLFTAPEQPIRIGSDDLTYYRDIATVDPYPGFWNGILSLIFNSSDPQYQFADQERSSVPYFHRAKAAELLATLDQRFPASTERAALHAKLIEAYGEYGQDKTVIAKGQAFLAAFPKAAERTNVSLAMADAYARMNRTKEEFAVYDGLLKELGSAASNVPLGTATGGIPEARPNGAEGGYQPPRAPLPARSADYAKVLDRYLARLAAMKRIKEAIALYRTEIDRNPNDPGLYDRLAHFLDENRSAAEIEAVYARATKQFQDRSWHHKLARWYLRQKQRAQFDRLTREIAQTFSGTDLERYFSEVVAPAGLDAALYRQVNLYAHQRFPHDLVFVKNLVEVYSRNETRDAAAAEQLLRKHWYYDSELRSRFFELLSRTGRIDSEIQAIAALPAATIADRAATEFLAEAQIWRCRFEASAPSLQVVANNYLGDGAINDRAASVYRSMGQPDAAVRFANRISRLHPGDLQAIARVGDIHADREQFDRARPLWNAMPSINPGRPDGYLEAATIYWDYFLYDDALRVIEQGRKQLAKPALLAYEAGAIHEGKRDYKQALTEYMAGAMAEPDGPARRRLLRLAARPSLRNAVESATAAAATTSGLPAFDLRVAVLEEQNRRDDLSALLASTASSTSSFDILSRIEEVASRNDLPAVRLRVMNRQIALTPDPVEKTRLRIAAARLQEQTNDLTAAERGIAEVYRDNPTLLGVVRAATDFYWRSKQAAKALDVLEQSASRANAQYRRAFLLEASRKATEIGQYARARKVLTPLLSAEPTAADLIAATADAYARAGDDSGMRTFLAERLKLTTGDAQAQLRRTLIPVLIRMKDFAGAIDQYIELVNRYPDDRNLLREVSDFARKHSVADRLLAFYSKTSTASPRDARWPAVLARLAARLDKLEESTGHYTRALSIRPDRTDLLQERAEAEERLLRFDEASKSYARLYELTYRNPQWLAKAAEARARLGDKDGALRHLRTAFLENAKPRAREYFEIARSLESWNWLPEARQFAADGLMQFQPDANDAIDQLALFMRVSTRLRQHEAAWANISGRLPEGSTDRILQTAAEVVRTYFTPEEKQSFARFLEGIPSPNRAGIAQSAGLLDVAVRALHQQLAANPKMASNGEWRNLSDLQRRRMQYSELASQLESYWLALPPQDGGRPQLLQLAAQNQRIAGNPKDELRLLGLLDQTGQLNGPAAERYGELLRSFAPTRLVELAGRGAAHTRNTAAEAALAGSDADLALKTIAARGQGLPPVWTSAYTALTGLYFGRSTPDITTAFDTLMGPRTVATQLAARPDANIQLVGDRWFPYASRYGAYLAGAGRSEAEDFLTAEVEDRPFAPSLYLDLGDWYLSRGASSAALAEFERAQQLGPGNPEGLNRIASVLAAQGKLAEAQAHWRQALDAWTRMLETRLAENFWTGVSTTFESAAKYKVFAALRPEADRLLRTYIRRNGQHRVEPLLQSAVQAMPDSSQALDWLGDLARASSNPSAFLGALVDQEWVPSGSRDQLFRQLLQLAENDASRLTGQPRQEAQWALRNYRVKWIRSLLATRRGAQAWSAVQALDADTRSTLRWEIRPLEMQAAAAAGTLETLLADYARSPEQAPTEEELRRAIALMNTSGQQAAALNVQEYLHTREMESGDAPAPAYLGLAEVRLKAGDTAGALALLRRMNHTAGAPFENMSAAASLLERNQRTTQAIEMWKVRVRAVPWDGDAAAELARLTKDADALKRMAADASLPYSARATAALASTGATSVGSRELDLLAASAIDVKEAESPYYFHARARAAEQTTEPATRVRLLRGALSIDADSAPTRIALFRAAIQADQPSVSIAAWYPLLAQSSIGYMLDSPGRYQSRAQNLADQFLSAAGLTQTERAQVARDMAGSYSKLNQAGPAIVMLRIAKELSPAGGDDAAIAALEQRATQADENRRRKPIVTEELSQPNRVRTRVDAGGAR